MLTLLLNGMPKMRQVSVSRKLMRRYFCGAFLLNMKIMKKKPLLVIILSTSLFFLTGITSDADDNGKLQLNATVITNSTGGVGTTSDFPIRGKLFTPELNQINQNQMQDKIPEHRLTLDFSITSTNTLYNTDTDKVTKQLFANYKPQVLTTDKASHQSQEMIWYLVMLVVALPLVALAIFLGQQNAKRRLRKKR